MNICLVDGRISSSNHALSGIDRKMSWYIIVYITPQVDNSLSILFSLLFRFRSTQSSILGYFKLLICEYFMLIKVFDVYLQ